MYLPLRITSLSTCVDQTAGPVSYFYARQTALVGQSVSGASFQLVNTSHATGAPGATSAAAAVRTQSVTMPGCEARACSALP